MSFKAKHRKAKPKGEGRVLTPWARAAWPQLFQPRAFAENQDPKFSVVLLFDEENVDLTAMKKLVDQTAKAKWGDKIPKNLHRPFRDGSEEKEDVEGFEGMTFITASSKFKPNVVDANLEEVIETDEIYSGMYCRATVNCYAYDFMGKKGVSFGLQNVQKLADGDGIGGGGYSAEKDFDDDDGGDDEDLFS